MRCALGSHVSRRSAVRAAILVAACGAAMPAIAQDRSWLGGNGLWNNAANWSPNGVPIWGNNLYIGNAPGVANSTLLVDPAVIAIGGGDFFISNGMTLDLNGAELATFGDVVLTGAGTTFIARPGPPGLNEADFQAETHINAGTHFQLIDNPLVKFYDASFNSGVLSGRGTIRLESWMPFRNEGVIAPSNNGGLVMRTTVPGMSVDLDGNSGNGTIQLTTAFSQLNVESAALSDTFSGSILMGSGSHLDMDIESGWTTDSSSTINVASSIAGAAAQISGSQFTLGGALNIGGTHGALRILSDASVAASADVFLGNDDRLEFDGVTEVDGGTFQLSHGARVDFDAPLAVRGGMFSMTGDTVADGSVNFNHVSDWDGNVTFNGVARQNSHATVVGATVINATTMDLDGQAGTGSWSIQHSTVVNADRINSDPAAPNRFTGAIVVEGGALAQFRINLPQPSDRWELEGYIGLEGIGALPVTRLSGAPVDVRGTMAAWNGIVQVTADTAMLESSTLHISAGSTLRFRGTTTLDSSTSFTAAGTLQNGVGGVMTLNSGTSLELTGLLNSGTLLIGESGSGVASVDRFTGAPGSSWKIDVDGYLEGVGHDALLVTGGKAALDGSLLVTIGGKDGVQFTPQIGDEFKILSAISGVVGTFDNDPVSNVGSQVYEWTVIYNPGSVVLRLDAIVPTPGSTGLFAIGLLAATRKRRKS